MQNHYTIYTMPNCPHCKDAKDLFIREGINFTEVTHFTREELIAKVGPVRTLPQILVTDGEGQLHIGGFTDLLAFRSGDFSKVRKLD